MTFSGKCIPKSVNLYGLELDVENYIMPVTQCFNCFLFGHTITQCRAKPKCEKCSEAKHPDHFFTKELKYVNCGNVHKATNKDCPEYTKQNQIKIYMSVDRIPYYEAEKMCPKVKKTPFRRQMGDFPNLVEHHKNILGFSQLS